jgi:hypothetical protein
MSLLRDQGISRHCSPGSLSSPQFFDCQKNLKRCQSDQVTRFLLCLCKLFNKNLFTLFFTLPYPYISNGTEIPWWSSIKRTSDALCRLNCIHIRGCLAAGEERKECRCQHKEGIGR